MSKNRRSFTPEYKEEAAKVVAELSSRTTPLMTSALSALLPLLAEHLTKEPLMHTVVLRNSKRITRTLLIPVLMGVFMLSAGVASAATTFLNGGSEIGSCRSISSPNGSDVLSMQCDGNLAPLASGNRSGNRAIWATDTAGAGTTSSSPTDQVVQLTNAERAKAGCAALHVDSRLTAAAQGHTTDMATKDYFSHTSTDGRTFDQRIRAAGYSSPAAENIARGQATPSAVMQDWMQSAGHRSNIINCSIKAIGVSYDPRGNYWTQNFGN